MNEQQPLIAMQTDQKADKGTQLYCVFKTMNSIMPGYATENSNYHFPNLPVGMPVTIIAIKDQRGKTPQISITQTQTSENIVIQPYTTTTFKGIKDKLAETFGEKPKPSNAISMATP